MSSLKRSAPSALLTMFNDSPEPVRLEDVHQAVEALAAISPDGARIVEMRFTLGVTIEASAEKPAGR